MISGRAWLVLALVAVSGCSFSDRLADYCKLSAVCTCDEQGCCVNQGEQCEAGSCCAGMVCEQGRCVVPKAQLQITVAPTGTVSAAVGNAQPVALTIGNQGDATTNPIDLTLTGDVGAFTLIGGTCQGQRLSPKAVCDAQVMFNPATANSFHADLHVTGGTAETIVGIDGTSVATLEIVLLGSGAGSRVTSDPPGIDCATADCKQQVPLGGLLLTETHDAGTEFESWDNRASGSTYTLDVEGPTTVYATFHPWLRTGGSILSGRIVSSPPGLDCGQGDGGVHTACEAPLSGHVQLFAFPDTGRSLWGWGNACQDAGSSPECDLDLDGPTYVYAAFR